MHGFRLPADRPWRLIAFAWALLFILPVTADAADRFVGPFGLDTANSCLSAGSPCATIQHAVNTAGTSDTIKVASGTYQETVTISRAFTGLVLSGSWIDEFTAQVVPHFPVSTIDNDRARRALTILADTISVDVTLDRFVLANNLDDNYGGAIRVDALNAGDATLTITNSKIHDNEAYFSGGGIYALSQGIGSDIDLSISRGELANNSGGPLGTTPPTGGGISATANQGNFTLTIEDCEISGNSSGEGAGIYVRANSAASTASVTLARNLIQGNASYQGGAAHFVADNGGSIEADLENNMIVENTASGSVGAESSPDGGALFLFSDEAASSVVVTSINDTITANGYISAIAAGGALTGPASAGSVAVSLTNAILRGNSSADLRIKGSNTVVEASHSNLGNTGSLLSIVDLGGNVDLDSGFFDSEASDYHLAASSDLIDAGVCSEFICQPGDPPLCFNQRFAPFDDFDGEDRPLQATCDIGADEVPEPSSAALASAALITLVLLKRGRG